MVENYLIPGLREKIYSKSKELEESLSKAQNRMFQMIDNQITNKDRIISEYQEILEEFTISSLWIEEAVEDVINEFIYEFSKVILYYFDAFIEIDETRFFENLDELKNQAKRVCMQTSEQLFEDYQKQLKATKKFNVERIQKRLEDFKLIDKRTEINEVTIKRFEKIIKTAGFELVEEFGQWYVKDKKTNKQYEIELIENTLIVKGTKIGFSATDKPVDFNENPNKQTYYNHETQKSITIGHNQIIIKYPKREIQIYKNNQEYVFEYNKKTYSSLDAIAVIIEDLKKHSPFYYEELMKDPKFKEIVNKTIQYGEDTKEIYVDKKDGKIKVNPLTKEKVALKLKLFGFGLLEKEDGLYAIELSTNQEHKIMDDNGWFRISDIPDLSFCTKYMFVGDDITTNYSQIEKGTNKLYINNLTQFTLFDGKNNKYSIKLTDKGIKSIARDKDGKLIPFMNDGLVLYKIMETFPETCKYILKHLEDKKALVQNQAETTEEKYVEPTGPKR